MKSENGCPFCQDTVNTITKSSPPDMEGFQVKCDNCSARGPIYSIEKEAISGWELGIKGVNGRERKC